MSVPLITEVLSNDGSQDIFYARNTYAECVAFIQKECDEIYADLPLTVTGKNIGHAYQKALPGFKNENYMPVNMKLP